MKPFESTGSSVTRQQRLNRVYFTHEEKSFISLPPGPVAFPHTNAKRRSLRMSQNADVETQVIPY